MPTTPHTPDPAIERQRSLALAAQLEAEAAQLTKTIRALQKAAAALRANRRGRPRKPR